jgi:hypothetical protein
MAIVVAADINTEGAKKVASKISKDGGKSIATHLDVSQSEDVAEFINKTANEFRQYQCRHERHARKILNP